MSLTIVTLALADFVASAWLVAVTCTADGDGRSCGAVYVPSVAIVPTAALPPTIEFTLHVTPVSLLFVTVAANFFVLPSSTEALAGETLTWVGGGGGGGGLT